MHQAQRTPSMTTSAPRGSSTAEKVRPQKTPPGVQTPPADSSQLEEPVTAVLPEPAEAGDDAAAVEVEVVVSARQGEAKPTFRRLAQEKLSKITKFDPKIHRVDVELTHEPNPRQADVAARVELTVRTRGPVVRAEAASADPIAALDLAWQKLQIRLRRTHQRRRHHEYRGKQGPTSSAHLAALLTEGEQQMNGAVDTSPSDDDQLLDSGGVYQQGEGPFLLREKTHQAAPMTVDEALYAMELVGHDFYLFVEAGSGLPCVLYNRHGYSYGLLRLQTAASSV